MLTCTVAVGPGMVAFGVPAKATKSRKPTPSKQFATESLSSIDTVTVSPAWNVVLLVPMTRSPARPPPNPTGISRVWDALNVVASMGGMAPLAGTADEPDHAERQACRHRREPSDALPPHVASPCPPP